MQFGIGNALGEITLVLFTTLAPAGAVACAIVCLLLALPVLEERCRERVGQYLWVPILVALVGLVASATHLGNPSNALYVLTGVGRSPLSNEIFFAVVAFGLVGSYWLMSFAQKRRPALERVWAALGAVAALAFTASMAFAYDVKTIITWSLPTMPANLMLNALVAGPLIALVVFAAAERSFARKASSPDSAAPSVVEGREAEEHKADAAPSPVVLSASEGCDAKGLESEAFSKGETILYCHPERSEGSPRSGQPETRFGHAADSAAAQAPDPELASGAPAAHAPAMYNLRIGRTLVIVSAVALVANVACYLLQGSLVLGLANSTMSVASLVPHYYACVAAFAVLAACGIAIDSVSVFHSRSTPPPDAGCATPLRTRRVTLPRTVVAAALALAGIFIMRFVFYMMHLTAGISL